jgi:hypothetical protein
MNIVVTRTGMRSMLCWLHPLFVALGLTVGLGIVILVVLFAGPPIAYVVESWWGYWGMQ